jgi:hypothetical protein
MVRINLLKKASARKKGAPSTKWIKPAIMAVLMLLVVGGITAAIVVLIKRVKPAEHAKTTIPDSTFVPTSLTSRTIVEDVVRDVQDTHLVLRETGLLDLPYADLSFEEKVNYEFLFARNVFELLSRVIPRQIGLESLDLDSFSTVIAKGRCSSREMVSKMFTDFRSEQMTILPRPQSSIAPGAGGGFRFTITLMPEFGLNLKDPLVDPSLSSLPLRTIVSDEVRKLKSILTDNKFDFTSPPSMISGIKLEKNRRLVYHFEAKGSYDNFVRAIRALHEQKMLCAFESLRMKALAPGRVSIKADVVFTTRD